jgi:hypothetical protein
MTNNDANKLSDLENLSFLLSSLDSTNANAAVATAMKDLDGLLDDIEKDTSLALASNTETVIKTITQEVKKPAKDLESLILDMEAKNASVPPVDFVPESQSPSVEISAFEEPNPPKETSEPAKPKRERKVKERGLVSTRVRFTFDGKDDDFFAAAGLERETFMAGYNAAPVKAMDKVQNVMHWFSGGPDLSIYTQISLKTLISDGIATSNSLKLAMMSNPEKPYPVGTASTQAGQMMAVFSVLGIATKEDNTLTLVKNSPIVKKFNLEM